MGIDLNRFRKNKPSEWVQWLSDDPSLAQRTAPVQPQVHQPRSLYASRPVFTPVSTVAPPRPHNAPPGLAPPIQLKPMTAQSGAVRPLQPVRGNPAFRGVAQPQPQPVRPTPMARPVSPVAPASVAAQGSATVPAVSIQISMPKFRLPKLPYQRIGYWAGGVALLAGLTIGGWNAYKHFWGRSKVAVKGTSTVLTSPSFTPVAPQNKPQLGQQGADPNSAYDGSKDLYTFRDMLMGFPVVVSQQPLPEKFKDANTLKKTAEGIGTVETVETAFGTAYIATVAKGETQQVMLSYQNRLVMVQSFKKFDAETWKYYLETLR
jgi:hypothetical protein